MMHHDSAVEMDAKPHPLAHYNHVRIFLQHDLANMVFKTGL